MKKDDTVEYNEDFIDYIDNKHNLIIKDINDIINALDSDEEEKLIIRSAILNLEERASKGISNGDIVSIPSIGICRKKLESEELRKYNKELREAKKVLNKEEYKDYARNIYRNIRNKIAKRDFKNKVLNKHKALYRNTYLKYAMQYGKAYADLWIQSLLWFKIVDYDQAVQDQYDRLNGRYEE